MRGIIFVILSLVLLFGCIGDAGTQTSSTINVSQSQDTGNEIPPVVVQINDSSQDGSGSVASGSGTLNSEDIAFKTSDSWEIHGTIYYSKDADPKRAIILVHMLGSNRSSFDPLVPVLHDEMEDADIIAIDARGQGESTNLGTLSKFKLVGDWKAMANDIGGAVEYLRFYRNMPDEFYVVGASIGSTSAIHYAAAHAEIQKIVMISPGMDYKGVDISKDLQDYRKRLLIVAGENDYDSAADAKTIYSTSKTADSLKKIYIYNGTSAHGTDLFAQTKGSSDDLAKMIADWLSGS